MNWIRGEDPRLEIFLDGGDKTTSKNRRTISLAPFTFADVHRLMLCKGFKLWQGEAAPYPSSDFECQVFYKRFPAVFAKELEAVSAASPTVASPSSATAAAAKTKSDTPAVVASTASSSALTTKGASTTEGSSESESGSGSASTGTGKNNARERAQARAEARRKEKAKVDMAKVAAEVGDGEDAIVAASSYFRLYLLGVLGVVVLAFAVLLFNTDLSELVGNATKGYEQVDEVSPSLNVSRDGYESEDLDSRYNYEPPGLGGRRGDIEMAGIGARH